VCLTLPAIISVTFAVGDRSCVFGIFIEQLNTCLLLGYELKFDYFDCFLVVAGDHALRLCSVFPVSHSPPR